MGLPRSWTCSSWLWWSSPLQVVGHGSCPLDSVSPATVPAFPHPLEPRCAGQGFAMRPVSMCSPTVHVVFCTWLLWCSVSAGYFFYMAWGCPGCTSEHGPVHKGGFCVQRRLPTQLVAAVALHPAHSREWSTFLSGPSPLHFPPL